VSLQENYEVLPTPAWLKSSLEVRKNNAGEKVLLKSSERRLLQVEGPQLRMRGSA